MKKEKTLEGVQANRKNFRDKIKKDLFKSSNNISIDINKQPGTGKTVEFQRN